jgi:hypothetical protein
MPAAVNLGRIEQGDTEVQGAVDDANAVMVGDRAVDPWRHAHAAKTERGHTGATSGAELAEWKIWHSGLHVWRS